MQGWSQQLFYTQMSIGKEVRETLDEAGRGTAQLGLLTARPPLSVACLLPVVCRGRRQSIILFVVVILLGAGVLVNLLIGRWVRQADEQSASQSASVILRSRASNRSTIHPLRCSLATRTPVIGIMAGPGSSLTNWLWLVWACLWSVVCVYLLDDQPP